MRARYQPDWVAGAAAGVIAGLAASWMMNRAQALVSPASTDGTRKPTTVKAADKLAKAAGAKPVPAAYRQATDFAVHYGLGAALGLFYGIAAEYTSVLRRGSGIPFGLGIAVLLDEGAVPALGITPPPWRFGLATHAYAVGSHAVFGAMLEATRRFARRHP